MSRLRPEWTLCGCAYALVIGSAFALSGCVTAPEKAGAFETGEQP